MGLITRQILICLAIGLFIGVVYGGYSLEYPPLGSCESNSDCLGGRAVCLRRECHCTYYYAYGDGKKYCYTWTRCGGRHDPCVFNAYVDSRYQNSHCVTQGTSDRATCKCNNGYFGQPKWDGRCMKLGKTSRKEDPCIDDHNCAIYAECNKYSGCACRDELTGDGENCKAPNPTKCSSKTQCTSPQGICYDGFCRCKELYAGNGVYCRKATQCPKSTKCGDNTECVVDPLFPKTSVCRCKIGYRINKNTDKCVECLNNGHCPKTYSLCVSHKCGCKEDLVLGETSCTFAPLHSCKTDRDCNQQAICEEEKCICQGNTIGNGQYCRVSAGCPKNHDCGFGTCLQDPLLPNHSPVCRCDKGYFKNTTTGKCDECERNSDCNTDYATCEGGVCKCKDELVKEGRTCKRAPLHPCDEDSDCHKRADCILKKCYCRGKSIGNGKFCRDTLACPAGHTCAIYDKQSCVYDPLFPKDRLCKCDEGTGRISDDEKCEVVNECFRKGQVCLDLSSCKKVGGTYGCVCSKGYAVKSVRKGQLLRMTCQDIDECMDKKPCSSNSVCINSKGGYECKCDDGYRNNAANKDICEDVDECSDVKNPCGDNERCVNQQGTYNCLCNEGYVSTAGGCVRPGRDVSSEVCRCRDHWECNKGECKCKEGYLPCTLSSSHWIVFSLSACQRTSECSNSWSAWAPKNNRGCCLLCCCQP